MLCRHVSDQLLDQHGLSHAGSAEQTDLTALGVGRQQIDDLDTGLQNLHHRALLLKGGRISVDDPLGGVRNLLAVIDGLAQHVEQSPQGLLPHGNLDAGSGSCHFHILVQALAGSQHQAAHLVVAQMLRDFHHAGLPVVFHRQRVLDIGKLAVRKFHIHNGTHNLYNSSFIHKLSHFLLFFCALAPAQTSVISCVIAACLALLYCIDSSFVSSVALSVADFMAIIRALCSLAKASTRHP